MEETKRARMLSARQTLLCGWVPPRKGPCLHALGSNRSVVIVMANGKTTPLAARQQACVRLWVMCAVKDGEEHLQHLMAKSLVGARVESTNRTVGLAVRAQHQRQQQDERPTHADAIPRTTALSATPAAAAPAARVRGSGFTCVVRVCVCVRYTSVIACTFER
jgi:hypothetical protein